MALLFGGQILRTLDVGVLHQLHGQCGGATFDVAGDDISESGSNNRVDVDTDVVIETAVFTGDCCCDEVGRHVFQGNFFTVLPVDLGDLGVPIGRVRAVLRPQGVLLCLFAQLNKLGQGIKNTNGAVRAHAGNSQCRRNHRGHHHARERTKSSDTSECLYQAPRPTLVFGHMSQSTRWNPKIFVKRGQS